MPKRPPEKELAKFVLFVGPSLKGESPPIEVFLDAEVRSMINRLDPAAWQALLHYVEDEIAAE